jgi:hypothetical protein
MNTEDMKRLQTAEAHRAKLKSLLDRGGRDRDVLRALGHTSGAFLAAYEAMWKRMEATG